MTDPAPRAARPAQPVKPSTAPTRHQPATDEAQLPPARALIEQLTAEVDALRAELAAARAAAEQLAGLADHDPLTGLYNRRGFDQELAKAHAYVQRYGATAALVYLDLDGFKPLNDRFGHATGDTALRAVAALLTRSLRASDVVGRLGGDEFALLLWNITPDDAVQKAQAIEIGIARLGLRHAETPLVFGASTGIAMLSGRQPVADVLHRADLAMYQRKRAKRGEPLT